MMREVRRPHTLGEQSDERVVGRARGFHYALLGAGLALASPSVIFWFVAVAVPVLAVGNSVSLDANTIVPFCVGFFTAGLLWSAGLAWVSSRLGTNVALKLFRWLAFLTALLFLFFACKLFVDGWVVFFS